MFGTTWKYSQNENRIQFDCKIGYITRKIISTLILPLIHFHISSLLTLSSHTVWILHLTIHSKLTSTHPSLLTRSHRQSKLHPTHQWERERESFSCSPTPVWAPPHTLTSNATIFPSTLVSFLTFLLCLGQPHLELCMYPIHKAITLPYAGEALPSSNISDLWLYRSRRSSTLKPTLYNTWSTSPQTI